MGNVCFFPIVRNQAELFYNIKEFLIKEGSINKAIFICPTISSLEYIRKKNDTSHVFTPEILFNTKFNNDEAFQRNDFDEVIHYELMKSKIPKMLGIADENKIKSELNNEAKSYLQYWEQFLAKNNIDMIFLWNGYIIPQATMVKVAEKYNIPILYCENGYYPNSFVMDKIGINAKSEFALRPLNLDVNKIGVLTNNQQKKKKLLDLINKIISYFILRLKIACVDVFRGNVKKFLRYENSQPILYKILNQIDILQPPKKLSNRYIFFPLQVITDSQLVYNYASSQESAIEGVVKMINILNKQLNEPIDVIFKEHPRQDTRRYFNLMKRKYKSKHIKFVRSGNTTLLLREAFAVVTINSSVGFQALLDKKNVFVLGDSIYTGEGLAQRVKDWNHFKQLVLQAYEGYSFVDEYKLKLFTERYSRYCNSFSFPENTKQNIKRLINSMY